MSSTTANIVADKERQKARAKARKWLHPFMPAPMHKPHIIRWLKHFHAWFGISGAVAGIIFAWSGFVLNHRADFRIGAEIVTIESTLPAPESRTFADGDEFGMYVKQQLELFGNPAAPAMGGGMGAAVPGVSFDGAPTRFAAQFQAASDQVGATYTAGDETIAIARQDRPPIRAMNRMHLGQAPNIGWQIIMDAFSGALIFLCISGVLIWTRLDGSRLVGAGLIGVSSGLTIFWIMAGA